MKKVLSMALILTFIISSSLLVSCSNNDTWQKGDIQNHPKNNLISMQKVQNERADNIKYGKDIYGIVDLKATKVDSQYLNRLSLSDLNDFMNFDDSTEWPKYLPKGFDPQKLMEEGKEKKLNLQKVHDKGYNGAGVGIAMIDQTLLVDHVEIKDNLKFYKAFSKEKEVASMHGVEMASIAVGKNVGVAPNADLYFVAEDCYDYETKEQDFTHAAEDILNIIELNKTLDNKIRVISFSSGYSSKYTEDGKIIKGSVELEEAIRKAEENNIEVLCLIPGNNINKFQSLTRTSYGDVKDFNIYKPYFYTNAPDDTLYVPTDKKTYASFLGEDKYAYDSWGGMSSIVPYVAGLYALACQADNSLTFEKFLEVADKTAYESECVSEEYGKQRFRIINPNAIIEELIN
ncbi:S8/S53 family peptidase [Clostridium paraputrificum]|uniref:S8/S53 family peptidase n=1 Tax=Clostridium paraputrificum TaxID=29363 RepID=UPI00189E0C25|nr:S8/S53 family peptidase [Clostridium paraputrificum]